MSTVYVCTFNAWEITEVRAVFDNLDDAKAWADRKVATSSSNQDCYAVEEWAVGTERVTFGGYTYLRMGGGASPKGPKRIEYVRGEPVIPEPWDATQ